MSATIFCGSFGRSLSVVACLSAGCTLLRAPQAPTAEALHARQLMVPVAGVSPHQVPDTFRAPRGWRAGIHAAVDILAPRGTPVLSADAGRVLRLQRNRKGGLTIYATDETERFVYYYAHLTAYGHGIIKGSRLARGQVIGFVGTTGNADRREPHLHFQVMVRPRGGRWWKGEPIDPRPFFVSTGQVSPARHHSLKTEGAPEGTPPREGAWQRRTLAAIVANGRAPDPDRIPAGDTRRTANAAP